MRLEFAGTRGWRGSRWGESKSGTTDAHGCTQIGRRVPKQRGSVGLDPEVWPLNRMQAAVPSVCICSVCTCVHLWFQSLALPALARAGPRASWPAVAPVFGGGNRYPRASVEVGRSGRLGARLAACWQHRFLVWSNIAVRAASGIAPVSDQKRPRAGGDSRRGRRGADGGPRGAVIRRPAAPSPSGFPGSLHRGGRRRPGVRGHERPRAAPPGGGSRGW